VETFFDIFYRVYQCVDGKPTIWFGSSDCRLVNLRRWVHLAHYAFLYKLFFAVFILDMPCLHLGLWNDSVGWYYQPSILARKVIKSVISVHLFPHFWTAWLSTLIFCMCINSGHSSLGIDNQWIRLAWMIITISLNLIADQGRFFFSLEQFGRAFWW